VPDHGQIVGYEHVGEIKTLLQLLEEIQDTGLNAHVEGAHRFIKNNYLGFQSEGASDADPLTLAPGEFMRVLVTDRLAEADEVEQIRNSRRLISSLQMVEVQWLGDNCADRLTRVE
jgi:hypothetical protein